MLSSLILDMLYIYIYIYIHIERERASVIKWIDRFRMLQGVIER